MVLAWFRQHLRTIVLLLTPLLLLPLLLVIGTMEARAGYILVLMSVYWIFEVIPLGITALFPVVLVPLFGILPSAVICPAYFKDSNMLFLGGLTMAVSIEVWDLHKRIALRVLLLFGVQPRWLLFGFLVPTWLLSMFISNTATTAMMIPIAEAVLEELKKHFEPDSLLDESSAVTVEGQEGFSHAPSSSQLLTVATETSVDLANDSAIESAVVSVTDSGAVSAAESVSEEAAEAARVEVSMRDFVADPRNQEFRGICKMMMMSLAYGAVFGGVATVTGTSPNVIFNGIVQENFGSETSFNYSSWLFYAFPFSVVCLLLSWLWLQISFLGLRSLARPRKLKPQDEERITAALRREYEKLGPVSFAEVQCIIVFLCTIVLWISREPGVPGWISLFKEVDPKTGETVTYMSDAQPAIVASILLFALPSSNPFAGCLGRKSSPETQLTADSVSSGTVEFNLAKAERPSRLLTWRVVQQKVSWQIVLLLGGGLALAETSRESGLSEWISLQLDVLQSLPLQALVFIVCIFSAITTELTSNSTTATIVLPILAKFSERMQLHPFFLMLPSAASCSFAFNLPISTPSNIMVYSRGFLTVADMVKTGFVMTLVSNVIVGVATLSYAPAIFNLYEYPSWARNTSATATVL
ncbi:hypothetical protein BOX15_Mlig023720g1 [Macrostomum lignano]|uniref:CitMHS domain-containing protein n=2 Tax=Macrostomum lignano TaxID=282301 RepID=A0A1I8GRJ6_9PLAT|nr:hypothetical protein BOX15_Mlig023720g1 [Macrostomum lignano]